MSMNPSFAPADSPNSPHGRSRNPGVRGGGRTGCGRVQRFKTRHWLSWLSLALLAAASPVRADKPLGITASEMALLPAYCIDTQTFKYGGENSNASPNAPKWLAIMGRGFWTMHHYCWALINLSRAQKPSMPANLRQATREYAIDDMRFVIENVPPDFIVLPEIYTKIGETLLLLKRPQDARDAFDKARSLKPDYWPAYYQWGEYLRQIGRKAEGRQVVAEGLSYSPDAVSLQRLLVSLGGDPASVEPRPKPAPSDDSMENKSPAN